MSQLFRLFNVVEQRGVGATSKKAYHFLQAQGVINTERGPQMVELMLDANHPKLEMGAMYVVEVDLYQDREKRLSVRVKGLTPVDQGKVKAVA